MGNALGLSLSSSLQAVEARPLNGVPKDTMTALVRSIESNPSGPEDPWNWTVDQVVDAVCYQKGSLLAGIDTSELVLTNPQAFEQKLRENSVKGLTFLKEVDHASLRDDLCMTSLGDRSSVIHLIQTLRRRSARYIINLHEDAAMRTVSTFDRFSSVSHEPGLALPFSFSPGRRATAPRPYGSMFPDPLAAPPSRVDNWVQEHHPPLRLPSLGQSSPGERSTTVPIDTPILTPLNVFSPSIPAAGFHDGPLGHPQDIETASRTSQAGMKDITEPYVTGSNASELERATGGKHDLSRDEPNERAENTIINTSEKKQRRLAPELLLSVPIQEFQKDVGTGKEISSAQAQDGNGLPMDKEPKIVSNKQGSPSSTTYDSLNNSISAVNLSEAVSPSVGDTDPKSEPGVVTVDDSGRKRMKPFLLTSIEVCSDATIESTNVLRDLQQAASNESGDKATSYNATSTPAKSYRSRTARRSKDAYLGTGSLNVDHIFYGHTPIGQETQDGLQYDKLAQIGGMVDHPEIFTILPSNEIGNGQRIYVNRQIQRFARLATPQKFQRKGREVTGVIPYPDSLARKHQPLSMTIFEKSTNGYTASRANRSIWHTVIEEGLIKDERDMSTFDLPDIPSMQQIEDPLDPDNLEKWKYFEGEDQILPAYGDSGSEGEYDLDTWREMEREQGKLERSSIRKSRHKGLDAMQVNAVIDGALAQFAEDWHMKMAPKLQRKTWRVWHKSRRAGAREVQLGALNSTIQHLDDRLLAIRKEILGEVWSSEQQVLKQTKSMQETVFDQEYAKWQVDIVKLNKAPERPPPLPQKNKARTSTADLRLSNSREEITDATDDDSCSSDEGMDDFIADDDYEGSSPNDKLTIVDAEDGEQSGLPSAVLGDECTSTKETSNVATGATDAKDLVKNSLFKLRGRMAATSGKEAVTKAEPTYIDLTQLSDPVEPEGFDPEDQQLPSIRTPPLDAVDDVASKFRRDRVKPVEFKKPPGETEIINLESDDEVPSKIDKRPASQMQIPAFHEVEKISKMDVECLEERQDRRRLLIWIVARSPKSFRQTALGAFDNMSKKELEALVYKSLISLQSHSLKVRGFDEAQSDAGMLIASWFISWTIPVKIDRRDGIKSTYVAAAVDHIGEFDPFYMFLGECLAYYRRLPKNAPSSQNSKTDTPPKRALSLSQNSKKDTTGKRALAPTSGVSSQGTPVKVRKYVVPESQVAKNLQDMAQARVEEQERRKAQLKRRFTAMRVNEEDPTKVIINVGKEDHHEFIYLNRKIGERIQEHQKDGVRFMWRELTADHKDLQGCLLAHTMGLGKTMQVITLLATLAEAARSSNEKVACQVPPALRTSQTLVLCPPALLENWYEEFLMWAPDPLSENIGEIRKVSSAIKMANRIAEIDQWHDGGGVLLLGYTTFRALVSPSQKSQGRPSKSTESISRSILTEEVRQRMSEILLETPNLIVADEAHSFKSLDTALYKSMNSFSSTGRIALTGSPLSNNLNEYYSVIEWITPNYLGNHVQFQAHYVEPIELGLYKESAPADYLKSRKLLKALQLNLEPKVHRADISVLKEKLNGKIEFLIRVPLTDIQEQIYREYVGYMLGAVKGKDADVKSTTLWSWLQDLRVLCNHPKCFEQKLETRLKAQAVAQHGGKGSLSDPKRGEKKKLAAQNDVADSDEENVDTDMPSTLTENLLAIYKTQPIPLDSVSLSFKTLVLKQILDLAEKAGDKALVFSHSILTLDYVGAVLKSVQRKYIRIDGATPTTSRQKTVREFNQENTHNVCLISTKAGGLGLNMYGANRVIILDTHFNPMHEEQAIGRSYRIGQRKPVYVYHLAVGGTFEEGLMNQAIFKQQLATRVVDKKNPKRHALKGFKQYLFYPKPLTREDFSDCVGKDHLILDKLLVENEG